MTATRTRFAPSPTGDLHLGGAWTALASWVVARRNRGAVMLRVEDIDPPRIVKGSTERILEDLAWLGLDWDEGPVYQSARAAEYEAAINQLGALVYPCDCSRQEIARAASAPHTGEETVYPGTCRDRDPAREMKRLPALRVRVPDEDITIDDAIMGRFGQNLARDVGDFVLKRGDGPYAYQLAVVIDDCMMHVSDVVRGVDLLSSAPRQAWLARMLELEPPRFAHVPLVVATDGSRLAKRTPGAHVRDLRASGWTAPEILGVLAHGLGLAPDAAPRTAHEIAALDFIAWRTEPWPIPSRFATMLGPR